MINRIIAMVNRLNSNWDPVPKSHAISYANHQWAAGVDYLLIDRLESYLGGLAGKRVLDLGGGPGQYSVEFAKRGAIVTWYDVSANYFAFASEKAREHNVNITYSLGYIDEARSKLAGDFDLVFNRICWYYCHSDGCFAKIVFSLLKPGGLIYVDTTNSSWKWSELPLRAKIQTWVNSYTTIKIGHPYPPRGRIARLFNELPIDYMSIDYSLSTNDRLIVKARSATNTNEI